MMQTRAKSIVLYAGLLVGIILSMFPFYWLIVMATRTTSDIYRFPPQLWLGSHFLDNITRVLQQIDFAGAFLNTLFVASSITLLVLFFDSLAGFAFAKFDFPGKKVLFVILLATMMVPSQLSLVPSFVMMASFGWVGTFKALIIPGMVNASGFLDSSVCRRIYSQGAPGCGAYGRVQLFSAVLECSTADFTPCVRFSRRIYLYRSLE